MNATQTRAARYAVLMPNGQLTGRTFINLGFAKVYARNVGGHVVTLENV